MASLFGSRAPRAAEHFPIEHSDDEWRRQLTPEQYRVLSGHGTERAGTARSIARSGPETLSVPPVARPLFGAGAKFESGTGWPSFWAPLPGAVATQEDRSLFAARTEVHCARCGGHLGHVFPDGPPPTGQRYCMNGAAMAFRPEGAAQPET